MNKSKLFLAGVVAVAIVAFFVMDRGQYLSLEFFRTQRSAIDGYVAQSPLHAGAASIVGDHAGDLIIEFILAMRHGLGLNKLLGTIHIYPTLVEANRYAAGGWKRAHAPKRALGWLERYHTWARS